MVCSSILVKPPFQDESCADDQTQDAAENGIQRDHHNGCDRHGHEHDDGVGLNVRLRRPHDLLQFALRVAEELGDVSPKPFILATKPGFFSVLSAMMRPPFLLRLAVNRVLLAETAVLLHLKTIGVVLLVLRGVVVALLALGAGQSDFNGHLLTPPL